MVKTLPCLNPGSKPYWITGLPGGGLPFYLMALAGVHPRILAVVPEDQLDQLLEDIQALGSLGAPVSCGLFPAYDMGKRLELLHRLAHEKMTLILTSPEALAQKILSPQDFEKLSQHLTLRMSLARESLVEKLLRGGYERVSFVEDKGQFAVRGQVLDIFSPQSALPLRTVWEGDQMESLRTFAVMDQKSLDFLSESWVIPAQDTGSGRLQDHLGLFVKVFSFAQKGSDSAHWIYDPLGSGSETQEMDFLPVPNFQGNTELFSQQHQKWMDEGLRTIVFCHNIAEQQRLSELLHPHPEPEFCIGSLHRGFLHRRLGLAVVANGEIFGRLKARVRFPKFKGGGALSRYGELKAGDFVVHEKYGIARYQGLKAVSSLGHEADYLCLEFKGSDKLYVPLADFHKVERYIGSEGKRPRIYSLDSTAWHRLKNRVTAGIAELAKELLKTAALRSAQLGHAFGPDSHLEEEFAASFLYEETPDQSRAIAEVKADMQAPHPMDRLVLGDVGYGKTEVAMRAAFKAVLDSKQVAVLVPTTILAEQHFNTFKERFADYPVRVGMLSRFQTKKQQQETLQALRAGALDIVIGTHRLFGKDVRFRDLGLVIVDEEQRFGVAHKEKLKAFRNTVDLLALSATPIPRTLSMALSGLRALSVIETPPVGREPIMTQVGRWDPKIIKAAVAAECARGGQVFYVHNRIVSLESKKKMLEELVPGLKVGIAHGQMPADRLEEVMWKFLHKHFDVLLASTIIESGLDIPNVNTLIIEQTEDFGLSQLYQLRGRVGRQTQRAYCYLFFSENGSLTETAQKRIEALREFTALGSGFQLALRDLEIRGAGNVLGRQQHGFIHEIGFELYTRLLHQEIDRLQGKSKLRQEPAPVIQLLYPAHLPGDYLPTDSERIAFYKRLLNAQEKDLESLRQELQDRCGPPPEAVENLFGVARLRLWAKEHGVSEIVQDDRGTTLRFAPSAPLTPEAVARLLQRYQDHLEFFPQDARAVRLKTAEARSLAEFLDQVRNFLSCFS